MSVNVSRRVPARAGASAALLAGLLALLLPSTVRAQTPLDLLDLPDHQPTAAPPTALAPGLLYKPTLGLPYDQTWRTAYDPEMGFLTSSDREPRAASAPFREKAAMLDDLIATT